MSQNGIGYSDVKIEIGKHKIKKVRLAKKTGFFASACAAALSRIVDKFPNIRINTGIEAWYMVSDILLLR
jgi:hypothetical protein